MSVKRSELLFIYDVRDANPNGDPIFENRPRMDESTGQVLVSDVRLKRYVRGYWMEKLGKNKVFVQIYWTPSGNRGTREDLLEHYKSEGVIPSNPTKEDVLRQFIDLRVFGALLTIKNQTISEIGPVQFGMGRSLNKVEPVKHGGTTVLASKEKKAQGTITEWWTVPYAVIAFYGIINPYFARRTGMSEEDVKELLEGMWKGIIAYTSRTKINQKPLLLMRIIYNDDDFEIGRIDEYVKIRSEKEEKEIRSPKEYEIDLSELIGIMKKFSEKIEGIEIMADKSSAKFNIDGSTLSGEELAEKLREIGFKVSELSF